MTGFDGHLHPSGERVHYRFRFAFGGPSFRFRSSGFRRTPVPAISLFFERFATKEWRFFCVLRAYSVLTVINIPHLFEFDEINAEI